MVVMAKVAAKGSPFQSQRLKNERSNCQLNFTMRRAASTMAK
jgi:hypothetical protein